MWPLAGWKTGLLVTAGAFYTWGDPGRVLGMLLFVSGVLAFLAEGAHLAYMAGRGDR